MQWKQRDRFPLELWLPALLLLLLLLVLGLLAPKPAALPGQGREPGWQNSPALKEIRLAVSGKEMWRLRLKRERALAQGILISASDDWAEATLWEGQQSWPVKIRLKGDWTDHLKRGKWSFRVKVKNGQAYRGLTVFSLQNPRSRSFLEAWHYHQVLQREGVLTTRYDYVRLALNGADLGVYALEEHFTKELLEAQGRRDGPIFKLSESGLWAARVEALRDTSFPYMNLKTFEAAHIAPFQASHWLAEPARYQKMLHGLSLMHQYKNGLAPASAIFDLDLVARQYALTDLFMGHHGLIWHNRRFYYNTIINKLEPVVYDAFAGEKGGRYLNGPFTGYGSNGKSHYGFPEEILGTTFLADDKFLRAYYTYLHQWTRPEYLDSIRSEFIEGLEVREHFLRREYISYRFSRQNLKQRAKEIRAALERFAPALLEVEIGTGNSICVGNFSRLAVEVMGWEDLGGVKHTFHDPYLLGAFDLHYVEWTEFPAQAVAAVWVRVVGSESAPIRVA
ncbi:MAG TPA: hypothetical protein ENJ82_05285, partial [Bacteroidetes bacterium]|nr:hypothetical protein [Bacteroidota bacterium]